VSILGSRTSKITTSRVSLILFNILESALIFPYKSVIISIIGILIYPRDKEVRIIKTRKREKKITRYLVLPFDMALGILNILP